MRTITEQDRVYLRRAVELAEAALNAGDEPFGSVLVDASGAIRFEDHNRVSGGDATRHPEFEIARWAAANLTPEERQACVVYTSGEHCAMCAAAHAMVGLGRIVYATSGEQLRAWRREWGTPRSVMTPLPINAVAPNLVVAGPDPELSEVVKRLQERRLGIRAGE